MCALFSPKKIPHFLNKKSFFFKENYDFRRKLEGGTGLQGVSSNLNVQSQQFLFFFSKPLSWQNIQKTMLF